MTRHRPQTQIQLIDAILRAPLIHDLGAAVEPLQARARRHPLAMHLAWGAMARAVRSSNRLDAHILDGGWSAIRIAYNEAAESRGGRGIAPYLPPLTADTRRHARDLLARPDILAQLVDRFTEGSVGLANELGLLLADGPGSRTKPHPTRTIYGDGTIVRPMYRHETQGRTDPDASIHARHDGTHWGNNLVCIAVRGPEAHRRVILTVGRVDQPGREAHTAVERIRAVHSYAGAGIQAVVYDGAFRGQQHETLMSEMGLIVVNKVHPASLEGEQRTWRTLPLGNWTHDPRGRACTHLLVMHNGSVHDATPDDSGMPTLSEPCPRVQVRRYPRGRVGGWRFSLGVEVPCPRERFTAWISPHATGTNRRRPDQFRLIAPADPHFQTLYGLRNDSEAINAEYKASLVWERAATKGSNRQLLDLLSWALLNNARAWQLHGTRSA